MKSIIVTGGAGFIGSNFIVYMLKKYKDYRIVNVDKLTYAGDLSNLMDVENHSNYVFEKGDICDKGFIEGVFKKYDVRGVIHFAAESHVDNSISGPEAFIQTNINGTFVLLNAAKEYWMDAPFQYKNEYKDCRFHHISTDEVYGTLGEEGLFHETTAYAPNSPYSASKASSDFIVRAYVHTYGLNATTSNCSNNYGPRQHKEKLIPKIIENALNEKTLPIYGDGSNVRDWLYVDDHCTGIDLVYHTAEKGDTYNIGGRNERTNLQIVNTICKILDAERPRKNSKSYADLITFVQDRPGHDKRYAIDATKIEKNLGWKADETFETGILKTVRWYLSL